MHGIYTPCCLMTLTLMQGHSGSAEENNQLWIISKTKQAIKIKLAATVGHNKFHFNPKFSVAFILNYGHKGISYKSHQCYLAIQSACFLLNAFSATWRKTKNQLMHHKTASCHQSWHTRMLLSDSVWTLATYNAKLLHESPWTSIWVMFSVKICTACEKLS